MMKSSMSIAEATTNPGQDTLLNRRKKQGFKSGASMRTIGEQLRLNGGAHSGYNFANNGSDVSLPKNNVPDISLPKSNGLNNPFAKSNGLSGAGNNGLNNSTLDSKGLGNSGGGKALSNDQKSNIGGAMAGLGNMIGGGGMANAPTAGDNAEKAQKTKSSIIGVVSAINPIVGGAIALGQGIGTAARKKKEAVDSQGKLLNKEKAERGYVSGHFFDPIGSMIEDVSNKNLSKGQRALGVASIFLPGLSMSNRKAYSEGLEKNARKNLGITRSSKIKNNKTN